MFASMGISEVQVYLTGITIFSRVAIVANHLTLWFICVSPQQEWAGLGGSGEF